jgi:Zn-dependent protease with chaperone function
MSIASIRFATHTRTWLLIAAVTALLIGIGALLGRAFLYLFAGLAAAMNVIGYWFSDRFALKAGRTQPVAPGTMPELEAMVQDLTRRAQVPGQERARARVRAHQEPRDILVSSIAALVAGAIAAIASLYAVNPLARQGVATLFATHPPIAGRTRRLRALDDDLALALAA